MAEARQDASLLSISFDPRDGFSLRVNTIGMATVIRRSIVRRAYLCIRAFRSLVWPASPVAFAIVITLVAFIARHFPQVLSSYWAVWNWCCDVEAGGYSRAIGACVATTVSVIVSLSFVQRAIIRLLLRYQGWMWNEVGKKPSFTIIAWRTALKVLAWRRPLTYTFSRLLPSLPVPSLQGTITRWLRSVEPLLTEEEFVRAKESADAFLRGEGRTLQRYLYLKSWLAPNYVSDWWEKYVYLRSRSPLPINSNYYGLDGAWVTPTTDQAARAARLAHSAVGFKVQLDREDLAPILMGGVVPLDMSQYSRMFGTTRVALEGCDVLKSDASARHIAVLSRGEVYRMEMFYPVSGKQVPPTVLEEQLRWILRDSEERERRSLIEDEEEQGTNARSGSSSRKAAAGRGGLVAALTGANRDEWAKARKEILSATFAYPCAASLATVESALFVLVLDTAEPKTLSEQGKLLLHGNGTNRWFDKSLSFIVFANGRAGLNAEHSWADAPVVAHAWEVMMTREFKGAYDPVTGRNLPEDAALSSSSVPPSLVEQVQPRHLDWGMPETVLAAAREAERSLIERAAELKLTIVEHSAYGKGLMKKIGVSPDAFIQLVLQVAYALDTGGRLPMTYESSMTRLFRDGRTETVRSLTPESRAFVESLLAAAGPLKLEVPAKPCERIPGQSDLVLPSATAGGSAARAASSLPADWRAKTQALFRAAASSHQTSYRRAMTGTGVDRHLFALYIVSQGKSIPSPFLNQALGSTPWLLSTSQQPQTQTVGLWDPQGADKRRVSPGGGFGPVSDQGYGVSYMIANDDTVFLHVTSSLKSKDGCTDSARFASNISRSFDVIRTLFQDLLTPDQAKDSAKKSQ